MSFEIDGFFSPELERFREAVRTTEPFKSWFDYALGLNRIGFDLLRHAASTATDSRLFTMHANFLRAHQSFQSALLLAERGLIPDTRTLVRSGVESANRRGGRAGSELGGRRDSRRASPQLHPVNSCPDKPVYPARCARPCVDACGALRSSYR
jgi:hypothetical protein